nr:MAG TPA: hypothetical protein [Caudoviricetes sp.]DAY66715.1 MAG TPA: hypothetical protein [Caudoviricetes sp.]
MVRPPKRLYGGRIKPPTCTHQEFNYWVFPLSVT